MMTGKIYIPITAEPDDPVEKSTSPEPFRSTITLGSPPKGWNPETVDLDYNLGTIEQGPANYLINRGRAYVELDAAGSVEVLADFGDDFGRDSNYIARWTVKPSVNGRILAQALRGLKYEFYVLLDGVIYNGGRIGLSLRAQHASLRITDEIGHLDDIENRFPEMILTASAYIWPMADSLGQAVARTLDQLAEWGTPCQEPPEAVALAILDHLEALYHRGGLGVLLPVQVTALEEAGRLAMRI